MHSSTRLCLLGLLVVLLSLCSSFSTVSADGSIQAFIDQSCNVPITDAINITLVSNPGCQHTKDSQGNPIAFTYYCNQSHFELTFWDNSTDCAETVDATWHVQSDALLSWCPVAVYEDADDKLFFYSSLQCETQWATQPAPGGQVSLKPFMALKDRVLDGTRKMIDVLQGGWSKPPTKAQ